MDTCVATAAYASKVTVQNTLNIALGALFFHCDIVLSMLLIADLQGLHTH